MTLGRLYRHYARGHEHGYKISAFYLHRLWKRRAQASMHLEHTAGDKMFVDFTGERRSIVNDQTGEITKVEVFVAILGASQMTYVEAVASQKVEDFISCCENAVHYFGGAPNAIVPDNLKSAVTKSNRYEPKLNENFEAFADHYGMAVLPALAYKPKDIALVEGAVKITYIKIFAELSVEPESSLAKLNDAIAPLLEDLNHKPFKGRTYSRWEQFVEIEKHQLQPFPDQRFELRRSLQATALKNSHICLSVDKHYYSVPYAYISKKLCVVYSTSRVDIFYKYDLIASHARERTLYRYTTNGDHIPSQHQAYGEWSPEYFQAKARLIHPAVELYLTQVMKRCAHQEQGYKSCQGILSFAKRVGEQRLVHACQRAHAYEKYSYRAIEDILKRGLDRVDPEHGDESSEQKMPHHENIRGRDYYKNDNNELGNDNHVSDESTTTGGSDE